MKNKRRGVSIVESREQSYCFIKEAESIPEQFQEYDYVDLSACDTMDDLLFAIMEEELSEFVLIGDRDKETLFHALLHKLAFIDEALLVRFWLKKSGNGCHKEGTVAQSVYAMMTGNYNREDKYRKTKQLFLADRNLMDEINLCDEMELNSEIYLPIEAYKEKVYQNWKKNYYTHIHFIGKNSIYLDGKQKEIPFHLGNYAQRKEVKPGSYLKLESREDYRQLAMDLEEMNKTGSIQQFQFYLVNECRWNSCCNLLNQRREMLCSDKTVYSCSPNQRTTLGGDLYQKYEERKKRMLNVKKKRQCEHCIALTWCSKCSGVFQEAEKEFCALMKQHPEVIDFVQIKNVLIKLTNQQKIALFNRLEFASYRHTLILPEHMNGRKPITHKKYLFALEKKYYYFDDRDNRIKELALEQAFIMEALEKGYCEEEISRIYRVKFEEEEYSSNLKYVHEILN